MSNRRHLNGDGAEQVPAEVAALVERYNSWQAALGHVRPGAANYRVQVVEAMHDGKLEKAVEVWTVTANGVHVVTLPPDVADSLSILLHDAANDARSKLDIARTL